MAPTEKPKIVRTSISVSKCIHLLGGLRAGTSPSGKLVIRVLGTPLRVAPFAETEITDQRRFVGYFRSIGSDMIGYEDIHADNGYTIASWRALDFDTTSVQTDLDYIWSGIRNAYLKISDDDGVDATRNVLFGLRAVSAALHNISETYGDQTTIAFCNAYEPGIRFKNLDTIKVFLSIHSFLVEMGILRDYLAKFISKKRFGFHDVTAMSSLLKRCRKIQDDPVASQIVEVCDTASPVGWMSQMSGLRDLIVHVAPLSSRTEFGGVSVIQCSIGAISLPQIRVQIKLPNGSGSEVDALTHCLDLYRRMLKFARSIASTSGIEPKHDVITEEDIR